jgi:hypothetical protein
MLRLAIRGARKVLLLGVLFFGGLGVTPGLVDVAHAQEPIPMSPERAAALLAGSHFWLAIVAGLVLAVGFQFLLTNLSFAAGVSAMRIGPGDSDEPERYPRAGKGRTFGERARQLTSGIGLWALVTASIALFFASWLAVELSLTISGLLGAIIGLTIWALFYLVMSTVRATAAWSLVGTLLRTVGAGIRTTWGGMSGAMARSDESRAADVAARITRSVKEELFRDVRMDRVRDEIRGYVEQLAPKPISPADVRKEVQQLHAVAQGVDDALRVIKEEAFSGKDRLTTVADTALRLTGRSKDEAVSARTRVEEWLRSTGKEALDPDGIKRDLERLFAEPAMGLAALKERARLFDRDTLVAVLAQRSDVTSEEAHRIVDTVERWGRALLARGQAIGVPAIGGPDTAAARERVTSKVRAYLESLKRPGLDYEGIRADVERLLEEPGVGADAIAERIKAVDRDTIKAILASRRDLDENDAERIIQQVEAARDSVNRRVRALRDEVERRLLVARDETLRQAEEARKTAATAAWWSVATAVVSAIAAAFGGMVAVAAG